MLPLLILTANVGSLGRNIITGNVCPVLKNCCNVQYSIKGMFGRFADVFGCAETQNDEIVMAPSFGLPVGTDKSCSIGYANEQGEWVSTKRGVCTYADNSARVIETPDFPKIESVLTIHTYADYCNGTKIRDIAYFNIYKNNHELSDGATIADIEGYVRVMMSRLKQIGVEEAVICGDFNFEGAMSFGYGLAELRDSELYHKHNSSSRISRIDRVFTNCPTAKIVHVFKSLENKSNYVDNTGEWHDDLGHKAYVIQVGRDKPLVGRSVFSCKRMKSAAANFKPEKIEIPNDKNDIEKVCEYLINVIQTISKACSTFHQKKKAWKPEELAIEMLERSGDNIWKRKEAAEAFYAVADDFMGKVKVKEDDSNSPSLQQFKEFHEGKLATIANPDLEKCETTMNEIYGNRIKTHIVFPNKKEFKKIIMKSSNSGAKDFFGISLKQTKILLKHNKALFNIYYFLCKAIAKIGHVPSFWKRDKISFLFKNKGTRNNPKYHRPITIACSYGKMFDRVIMDRWNQALDFNDDNHAYRRGSSCTSAIADVQNYLKDIRFDATHHNLNLLTFICAEDISSAFESIAHKIIELYSELTFESSEFNMPLLSRSYLDRQSFITDREGSELVEVFRTFADQTSPQGSSNSPCWWRVYDGGFSAIFKKYLGKIKLENGSKIHDIFHVSYADDHLIAITLDLSAFKDDDDVQKSILELSKCVREDLIKSTQIFGCRIAPDKSEILAPKCLKTDPKNTEIKPKIVDEFTWLGYSLGIENNYLVFTPKRMHSRFKTVYEKFHSMCQYIQSINVKRKIYDVYVSPVVEVEMSHFMF